MTMHQRGRMCREFVRHHTVGKLAGLVLASLIVQGVCAHATHAQRTAGRINTATRVGQVSAGHDRMLAILQQIKDRIPEEHLYYGRGQHKTMRRRLANLSAGASSLQRFQVLAALGNLELLYEEYPRQAIKHLTEAYEMLPELVFPDPKTKAFMSTMTKFVLGVAHLRLGETENCCLRHSSESCILPIRGAGVHRRKEGSRQAISLSTRASEPRGLGQALM